MPTTTIPGRMIRALADNRGVLKKADFDALHAAAKAEGLTGPAKRALLQPEKYLATSPELKAAKIGLADIRVEPEALKAAQGVAKQLGTEAFPMLLEARGQRSPKTKMEKAAANLRKALARAEGLGPQDGWKVQTSGADVRFSVGVEGKSYPALVLDKPVWRDPAPRDLTTDAALTDALRTATNSAALRTAIEATLTKESAYLAADGVDVKTKNERYGIMGLRRDALFDALAAAVRDPAKTPALGAAERTKALGALVELRESTFVGRDFPMEVGSHTNYWPYWANYAKALVKIAEQTDRASPDYPLIENRIRDILRHKTVFGRQLQLDEHSFEKTANAALVHQPKYSPPPGHRVSIAKTSHEEQTDYELLSVKTTGLPADLARHAGAKVYRDGDKLFFDHDETAGRPAAGTEVPAALAAFVEAKAVANPDESLTLRELRPGEKARDGIALDWDQNGTVNLAKIFIGWWGHCHNEAPLNAMGVDPRRAVELYREDRSLPAEKASVTFTKDDVWDLAGAFVSDAEDGFSTDGVRANARIGETDFVGERNNGNGYLFLEVPGRGFVRFSAELVEASEKDAPEKRVADPMSLFRKSVAKPDGTFEPSPDYAGQKLNLAERDVVAVDVARRKLAMKATYVTLDDHGRRYEENRRVVLDPAKNEPVLISEELVRRTGTAGGQLRQHYLNPATQEYSTADVDVKDDGSGKYTRTELSRSRPVKASSTLAVAESTYDSADAIHGFVAKSPGLPFTFDTDSGKAVWNYPVRFTRIDREKIARAVERGQEYTYTTYHLRYETMGGPTEAGSDHRYVLKRDAAGKVVDALALTPMPDFAFRQDHWVSAPVAVDALGRRAVNLRAKEAGYLTSAGSTEITPALWKRQADVLYAGLRPQAKNEETAHVWELEDGSLVAFSDPIAFEAAKKADLQLRALESSAPAATAAVAEADAGWGCFPFWRRRVA
ncbi:hypothetical protein L6R52_16145 [Myxococcota bacterium]|nr:hypothetical protein [Myxococcota bacterium]